MKSACIVALVPILLLAGVSRADDSAFRLLIIDPPASEDDVCRNGIIAHRIEKWRQQDHIVQPQSGPFASVETIMKEVMPDAVADLQKQGCDPRYLWGFIACTDLDDPGFKSEQIIPRGVTADSDMEMAEIMRICMDEIAAAGVKPAL